jgi:DNA-binding transcriptional MerR regulator
MPDARPKSDQAFRTIGELASDLGVPQHVLRYWETRFPQLKPLQRAGNRRYYRPDDVALARRIHRLLNRDGYTVRGVQQLLESGAPEKEGVSAAPPPSAPPERSGGVPVEELRALRRMLADALAETAA